MIIFAACGNVRHMSKSELTTKEAAARLEQSERLVRLWCQQGRFPSARRVEHPRGDYWVIPLNDVVTFTKPKPGPTPKPKIEATNGQPHVARKSTAKKGGKP